MSDLFVPLNDYPAYRQIANLIEQRIVGRSLRTGDALPSETDLARQFGVNRSTVREAIRELEIQGLLGRGRGEKRLRVTRPEHHHISGGISRALALHDVSIRDVWEGLIVLEPPIAEAAAKCRQQADLATLEATVADAMDPDTDAAARQAAGFFRHVGEASHNRVLMLAHEPLLQLLAPSLRRMIDQVEAARARIATAQRRILAAVRDGDVAAARSWTEKHIRDYRRGFELAGIDLTDRVD